MNRKLISQQRQLRSTVNNSNIEPAYSKLGLTPKEGGRSLLHHENGVPIVPPKKPVKSPVPPVFSHEKVRFEPVPYSGMNNDTMWFEEDSVAVSENRAVKNNHTEEFAQGINPQSEHEQAKNTTQQDKNSFPMERGEFAVLVDGEIVETSFDLSVIRSIVEEIMVSNNIDMDRINVIKNINIDFGVILLG